MHLIYNDVFEKMAMNSTIQKHSEKIEHILECAMDHLKECNHKKFEELLFKLHKVVYDYKFSKNLAIYAVMHMENKDPKHPKGEFWSMREVETIAKQYGLPHSECEMPTIYFLLHMMRSDYFSSDLSEKEIEYYVELAKDWLNDKDIPNAQGKTFNYWYHIVKGY